ncbi:MAG TPA: patatin-like phospholipase family protein [Thermotogota bacterium]|nr:patatin-like phospholipase family protein [Thermotogota bacterium]
MKGLGIALGAGGARGFAHVAVLRLLCEKDMVPSYITGSSMGSVIGSAFALFKDIRTVEKLVDYFVEKSAKAILELIRTLQGKVSLTGKINAAYKTTATRSMMDEYFLYDLIGSIFGKARFSDTKIPLGVVATDMQTGKKELFDYGFIADAVCASSSVPGAFSPVSLAGSFFVDGGVTRVVPVEEAYRLGAKTVIGVDVSCVPKKNRFESTFDLLSYVDDLKGERLVKLDMERAQLAIYFDSLDIDWFRFDRAEDIIAKSVRILSDTYEKEIERLSLT